ncbi:MAG TPA: carboxypeptidase regulatory-like domain-containing protein, partial [Candidatus Eisenbacteria bacterium]|nr:carboxypeptidase regulatory-like domain-containing protein [Candidatus Eisenbacteria bacterium]
MLLSLSMLLVPGSATAQTGTITGRVVDENGAPLQNATVVLLGTPGVGAPTNAEGRFMLARIP